MADSTAGDSAAASPRPGVPAPSRPSALAPANSDETTLLARMRNEALAARSRAAAAGASAAALARGDASLAAGDSLRAARRTVRAAARFSMATTLWNDAADGARHTDSSADSAPPATASAAPAPPAAPAPESPRPPVAVTPSSPAPVRPSTPAPSRPGAPASDPAPAIHAVFAQYAEAIEARSIPAIRRVYPGLSPAQSKDWEEFFAAVSEIDVDLAVSDLAVSGDSADARLSGVYVFQNPGTRRTVREPVSFQAHLRRQGGDWRIETLR